MCLCVNLQDANVVEKTEKGNGFILQRMLDREQVGQFVCLRMANASRLSNQMRTHSDTLHSSHFSCFKHKNYGNTTPVGLLRHEMSYNEEGHSCK